MRCGGCKAAGIDREIWFYGEARARISELGWFAPVAPESNGICTVADRNSNRTSYQPEAYSNPQNELYVREQERWAVRRARRRNQLTPTPANRALAWRKSTRCTNLQRALGGYLRPFPSYFRDVGALILSSTGRGCSRGSSTQDLGSYDFEKRISRTLRSTYFER